MGSLPPEEQTRVKLSKHEVTNQSIRTHTWTNSHVRAQIHGKTKHSFTFTLTIAHGDNKKHLICIMSSTFPSLLISADIIPLVIKLHCIYCTCLLFIHTDPCLAHLPPQNRLEIYVLKCIKYTQNSYFFRVVVGHSCPLVHAPSRVTATAL